MPSRQRKHGGGKFESEKQRRWMWANVPAAARKWAHNRKTSKANWKGRGGLGRLGGSMNRRKKG